MQVNDNLHKDLESAHVKVDDTFEPSKKGKELGALQNQNNFTLMGEKIKIKNNHHCHYNFVVKNQNHTLMRGSTY
jgi:hypothetical protein